MGGGGGGGGAAGGGGGNANGANAQALQAEIERLFPFTPNQPFEVTFECSIGNVPGVLRPRPDPSSGRDTPYYIEFQATPGLQHAIAAACFIEPYRSRCAARRARSFSSNSHVRRAASGGQSRSCGG